MTRTPSPPPAPDPAIQTANESAANRYNINSPFGTQTWSTGGRETIGYDSKGAPIYGEQRTQNITLSPSEQRQYDLRNNISETLMKQGQQGIEGGLPDYNPLESAPDRPGNISTPGAFDPGVAPVGQFDPQLGPQPTTSREGRFDPALGDPGQFDINKAGGNAADAHYQRIASYLKPYQQQETDAWEQRMANQGLPVGSEAYGESFGALKDSQNRSLNDAAYEAAIRSPELALSERGQQMSDRGQVYGEKLGTQQQRVGESSQYYGEDLNARRQQLEESLAGYDANLRGGDTNFDRYTTGRGAQFGEQLAAQSDARTGYQQYQSERDRQFQEDLQRRQQYYNEIAASLGGQQLNPLNAGGGGGDANLDVSGAYGQYNQATMNAYNQKLAAKNAQLAAAAGLGSAALGIPGR